MRYLHYKSLNKRPSYYTLSNAFSISVYVKQSRLSIESYVQVVHDIVNEFD